MTDDQNPWYSDGDSGTSPPTAPEPGTPPPLPPRQSAPPGHDPQQYPYPQQPPPQQYPYPQQSPTGYQPYGQPGFGSIPQTNGKATTSMVLGIVGLASMFFCYGIVSIVMGPIAYFLGRSAQKEMERDENAWSNTGMAKAGWIMGLIQTILSVLLLGAIAAFFIWAATIDESNF